MIRPIVAAYYYPGYHRTPVRHIRGGDGSEWPLLFDAEALRSYPDMRRPAAGPQEPSPQVLAIESALAASYGIDAFLFCWYWDHGSRLLNAELDHFLRADLPSDFQYALLWVNKRPYLSLPLDSPPSEADARARLVETDEADFEQMVCHLVQTHFCHPRYIRFENRPLLQVFLVEPLIRKLGARRLAGLLDRGNAIARSAGFDGIYYVACIHHLHSRPWLPRAIEQMLWAQGNLAEIGFSAVTTYVLLPDWESYVEQSYSALVARRVSQWPEFVQRFGLPFWPSVSPGWDARARGTHHPGTPPRGHPWLPLVRGESPRAFGALLDEWKRFAGKHRNVRLLPVASWNEWTEGHAIAPCTRHGDGMLRTLLHRLGPSNKNVSGTRSAVRPGHAVPANAAG